MEPQDVPNPRAHAICDLPPRSPAEWPRRASWPRLGMMPSALCCRPSLAGSQRRLTCSRPGQGSLRARGVQVIVFLAIFTRLLGPAMAPSALSSARQKSGPAPLSAALAALISLPPMLMRPSNQRHWPSMRRRLRACLSQGEQIASISAVDADCRVGINREPAAAKKLLATDSLSA
jgi:hypothetical protein